MTEEERNIDELRKEITASGPAVYQRPEIPAEWHQPLERFARRLNAMKDQRARQIYVTTLIFENARLAAEVNKLRSAAGIEPLQLHDWTK